MIYYDNKMKEIEKYRLIDDLFNVYLDTNFDEKDNEIFSDDSVDTDEIVKKNLMLFKQLRTQTKAEINKIKHERVLSFLSELKDGIRSNIKEYQDMVDKILSKPRLTALQPMFRNYESSSDEDKKSILMDSELLDMLSDIEEEYNRDIKNED